MEIQLIIPWGNNNKNLGKTYNRLMQYVEDWVCFLDHDILQLNPNWYHMCLNAIDRVGHKAGWITGVTNAIACAQQLCLDAPKSHRIDEHILYARRRYEIFGEKLILFDPMTRPPFSGFMILTHRKAWEISGGFPPNGFLGVDNGYHQRLLNNEFNTYIMPGLYMYHTYKLKMIWNK